MPLQQSWRLAVLGAACFAACSVQAQSALKETVVTASRFEQDAQDALPATTLITRADLDRAQTPDLPTLLRSVVGVEIAQTGGMGAQSSVFMRGASSSQSLVLIDGVAINNVLSGGAALEHLPMANIDHIEIVRGNVSALYGSAALGGVIQIFTREGTAQPQLNLSTQLSSKGLRQASASGSVKLASGTSLSATLETINDKGINAINPNEIPGTNPDRDGYTRQALSAALRQDIGSGSVGLRIRNAQGKLQYDDQYGTATQADVSQYAERGVVLDGKFKLSPSLDVAAALTSSADQLNASVTAYPYLVNSLSKAASLGLQWQAAANQRVTAGLERTRQSIQTDASTVYDATARTQNSLRLGYSAQLGHNAQHQLQLNLRADHYSDFGSANTGFIGYGYRVSSAWRVNASYATGFKAPTFQDLYYPGFSNPNLRPESAKSTEIGLQHVAGANELRMTLFKNRYADLIAIDGTGSTVVNVNSAQTQGLETSYKARYPSLGNLGVHADLTLQDPKDLGTGLQLARRAKTLAHLGLAQSMGPWALGASLAYTGTRFDDAANATPLAAYTLLGLSASRWVAADVTVFGRIDNLLNAHYESAYGYNQPGRTVFVGLRWQPGR